MADTEDFFKAVQGLAGQLRQYGVANTYNQMTQRKQEIQANIQDASARRQAQAGLADEVYGTLLSQGVAPDQALAVRTSIVPQTPSSAQQAILMGQLNGDTALTDAGKAVMEQELNSETQKLRANFGFQSQLSKQGFGQSLALQNDAQEATLQTEGLKARTGANINGDQWKANAFATTMTQSLNDIKKAGAEGYSSPSWLGQAVTDPTLKSAARNRYESAQSQWVNSVLRRESGAAISDGEAQRTLTQYFPIVGDSQQVIADKARQRELRTQSMILEAGPAWERGGAQLVGSRRLTGGQPANIATGEAMQNNVTSYLSNAPNVPAPKAAEGSTSNKYFKLRR